MTADQGRLPTIHEVRDAVSQSAFGAPLIQNNLRALVVETIVEFALAPNWKRCGADWSGWDFQHLDGMRLEVKQSARRQTWASPKFPAPPRFDIAERTGYYEGPTWIAKPGRPAQIYIFALHEVIDETADHRDALQWSFYVVPAGKLPATKSLSASAVEALSTAVRFSGLSAAVEAQRGQF